MGLWAGDESRPSIFLKNKAHTKKYPTKNFKSVGNFIQRNKFKNYALVALGICCHGLVTLETCNSSGYTTLCALLFLREEY